MSIEHPEKNEQGQVAAEMKEFVEKTKDLGLLAAMAQLRLELKYGRKEQLLGIAKDRPNDTEYQKFAESWDVRAGKTLEFLQNIKNGHLPPNWLKISEGLIWEDIPLEKTYKYLVEEKENSYLRDIYPSIKAVDLMSLPESERVKLIEEFVLENSPFLEDNFFKNIDETSDLETKRKGQIKNIADAAETRGHDVSNSDVSYLGFEKNDPENFSFIAERLKNRPLIELASGSGPSIIIEFASKAGASEYIGVDKYSPPDSDKNYKSESGFLQRGWKVPQDFKIISVHQDALRFMASQPDDRGSIMVNGLDSFIVPPTKQNQIYIKALMKEVARVVGQNGVVISSGTYFTKFLLELGFGERTSKHSDIKIYYKL